MSTSRILDFCLSALVCASTAAPAVAAIRLIPVATGALISPILVTNAGDNSNRLFIVEQGGRIKVLQPAADTATTFLDISTGLAGGGEQGLLGLAFHPQYAANGRFFVYYTRDLDNAIVIAEHQVTANPDVADPNGSTVLVIPHPDATNHNGGMLAFGADGYLYIGVGDGGGANDPANNAQNIDVLLGKILRIDVDPPPGSGVPYQSPVTNPFYGATPGRDEIFAVGLRNPWRFSFDRTTGQQWVGDVGQGAREEVDTPIVPGGNYGWRVYEGFDCTTLDPSLCVPTNFEMPVFEYDHSFGRCSLTGGHVYRGGQGALPQGTYVYADFCSGEVFSWDGATQSVLLQTTMNISSFGEDEQGELYVVNLGGTVDRIVGVLPCAFSLSSRSVNVASDGGSASVAVGTGPGCDWTATTEDTWIQITAGATGVGPGATTFTVAANPSTAPRVGMMAIADGGQRFTVVQAGAPAAVPRPGRRPGRR